MKYLFLILLGMLFLSQIKAQERGFKTVEIEINGQMTELYKQSHALVIGVSDYTNGWPDLPGVKNDITKVKQALEENNFNVVIVENPNDKQLEDAIEDFINLYGSENENRLLFYFAGHGHTIKTSYGENLGYIVPSNAPNPNYNESDFQRKSMEMARIEIYAKRIQSKHVLFIFDACFSGQLFALSRAVPEVIGYKTSRPVRQFITSGSADETVPDHSIFRQQFISALNGEADLNHDNYITGSELGDFLQTTVINYSRDSQHPQYGKIRNPNLDKGDFVFIIDAPPIAKPESVIVITEEKIKKVGSIKLTTEIEGSLYFDNIYQRQVEANTLLTLNDIAEGEHQLKITGEHEWTQKVIVNQDQVTSLVAFAPEGTNLIIAEDKNSNNISNPEYSGNSGIFTDVRDSQKYDWVKIGSQIWMAKNLQFDNTNSQGYYKWGEALKVCPNGWHLPSETEWESLINYLGGEDIAGFKLMGTSAEIEFNALPTGFRYSDGPIGKSENVYWWSSTKRNGLYAWAWVIYNKDGKATRHASRKPLALPVRCLKN